MMSLRVKFFALLILAALLPACALTAPTQTPPPPDTVVAVTATPELPTAVPALTVDALKNAEYSVQLFDPAPVTFKLAGGGYQSGTDPAVLGYLTANTADKFAFGDLDGDGIDEAVTVIGFNTGGTGVFMFLFVMRNQGGAPVQVGNYAIDDRAIINDLKIENGEVVLDALVHGIDDPGCCASFNVIRTYRIMERYNNLIMTSQASKTANGLDRVITIDSPADGSNGASPVHITGSVTISPFEATLAYRIYDPSNGAELKAGSLMVDAPDMGAPGTFEVDIPLDIAPAGPYIRIELQDISMADGSLLTMDSVTLMVP